jgi:hypothetical protein
MNILQKHAALDRLEDDIGDRMFGLVRDAFARVAKCKKPEAIRDLQEEIELGALVEVDDIVAAIERELDPPQSILKGTAMAGPTFAATFADGQITRMSVNTEVDRLDVGRGVRLARAAYESRMKKEPPAISAAHFEQQNGDVLQNYDADELIGLA